jgi:hypothetical protein
MVQPVPSRVARQPSWPVVDRVQISNAHWYIRSLQLRYDQSSKQTLAMPNIFIKISTGSLTFLNPKNSVLTLILLGSTMKGYGFS